TGEPANVEEATATNIHKVGENEWSIGRDELSRQFENLHQLLKEARLIPHFRDDQAAGFVVTRLSSKSFLEQIGLRNGDILTGINGQKLNTLEEALQAYQALLNESVLQLEVERNQRKELFTYEIR
ncbi:MAG: PDZ domain-containing protein, partial [Candidatus Entotheonellia bacterium]